MPVRSADAIEIQSLLFHSLREAPKKGGNGALTSQIHFFAVCKITELGFVVESRNWEISEAGN